MKRIVYHTTLFFLLTFCPYAQEVSEMDEQESIEDLVKKIENAENPKELFEKVLVPMEKKDPRNKSMLDLAALTLFSMKDFDKAEKYIIRSLSLEKTDQSLTIFVWICSANLTQRFDILKKYLQDIEKIKEKDGILIRTLLAIAYRDKDLQLYLRIIDYLTLENLTQKDVLKDFKTVSERFKEESEGSADNKALKEHLKK